MILRGGGWLNSFIRFALFFIIIYVTGYFTLYLLFMYAYAIVNANYDSMIQSTHELHNVLFMATQLKVHMQAGWAA